MSVVIGRTNDIGYGLIKYYYKKDCSKHNILNINVKEKENIINNICVKNNYYDFNININNNNNIHDKEKMYYINIILNY